jgi:hypothetical protein
VHVDVWLLRRWAPECAETKLSCGDTEHRWLLIATCFYLCTNNIRAGAACLYYWLVVDSRDIHSKIKFTLGKHNKLNCPDLTVINKQNQLTFGIYRKPTTTDLIIHNKSCHQYEHKKSAIKYIISRINIYPITHEEKDQEYKTIREILENNHYHQQIMHLNKNTIFLQITHREYKNQNGPPWHIMAPIREQSQNY